MKYLRGKLAEADGRARKLISARKHGTFQRSAAMEAARRAAMDPNFTGKSVVVEH